MSSTESRDKVVILDRDGTVVIDRGYLSDPAGLEFEPGAADALRWLHSRGFRLVVITNQSGVGRGYFPIDCVIAMNARLAAMAEEAGAKLSGIYFCPHAPDAGCGCRKPAQGLMNLAAADLGFEPKAATVVGDKESDIEFGRRAGATTVLLAGSGLSNAPAAGARVVPDLVAANLMEAARAITERYDGPEG
jgi:D-glycero-D-manno-heptose 1,7-bisphosphate phosphatase